MDKYLDKELNPTKLISLHVHNLRLKEMVKEIAQHEFDHLFVFLPEKKVHRDILKGQAISSY